MSTLLNNKLILTTFFERFSYMQTPSSTPDQVLIALRKIMHAIDLHSKKLVKKYGVTGPQLIALKEIEKHGQISLTALAKKISLSLATISSMIDRLEKHDYIRRTRAEKDKRTFYVCITEAGTQALAKSPNLLQEEFLRKFEALEEWEQHLIVSSLQRIASMMNAENIETVPYLEL